MILFNFSSNSPRYLVPATKEDISIDIIFLFFKAFGTSPFFILLASSSTIALFPTPASPIKRGLFLFFLNSVSVIKSISFSRPTTKLSDKSFDISFPILYISNFWLLFLSFSFISS